MNQRVRGSASTVLAGLVMAASCLGVTPAGFAQETKAAAPKVAGSDVLIFRKGNVLKGTIVSETATTVKFTSDFNGLPFTTDYPKSDLLEIKHGAASNPAPAAAPATAPTTTPPAPAASASVSEASTPEPSSDKTRYCYLSLTGTFGQDISQSPIRKAMKEAIKQHADVVIVEVDNDWKRGEGEEAEDQVDAAAAFDEFHRAEHILQVFAEEMPDMARDSNVKPPRLVFWVRKAMGGAAFLPLISPELYFHPEGKIGGIGNLATMLKGHERVVEKQISLRLKRAIGWVNLSGYPYAEQLVRAMTQDWYVCSLKYENGKPVLFEGTPSNPSEELLTDDGKEANRDTIEAIARNEGNDSLTLNERNAKLIGFSKGTIETKAQLLATLNLDRGGFEVPGKPEKVMQDWRDGLDRAKTQVRDLWREYREIQVQGDFEARRKARSSQIQKLEALKSIFKIWAEGMEPRFLYRLGIPLDDEGGPNIATIDNFIEKIKIQQRLDKR